MASGGAHENLSLHVVLNIVNLPESVDDYEGGDFDGDIGGKSTHRIREKRKLQGLQDKCRLKKRMVLTDTPKRSS